MWRRERTGRRMNRPFSRFGTCPFSYDRLEDRALLTVVVATIGSTEGILFNDKVATFQPSDVQGSLPDLHAAISWGDGNASNGTIAANMQGGFDVLGANMFQEAGQFPVTVTVTGLG